MFPAPLQKVVEKPLPAPHGASVVDASSSPAGGVLLVAQRRLVIGGRSATAILVIDLDRLFAWRLVGIQFPPSGSVPWLNGAVRFRRSLAHRSMILSPISQNRPLAITVKPATGVGSTTGWRPALTATV